MSTYLAIPTETYALVQDAIAARYAGQEWGGAMTCSPSGFVANSRRSSVRAVGIRLTAKTRSTSAESSCYDWSVKGRLAGRPPDVEHLAFCGAPEAFPYHAGEAVGKTRAPMPARVRFEILKRDGFACVYCGAHPPGVLLHVDHLTPVCDGGGDEPENLVTACATCNGGKGPIPLSEAATVHAKRTALLQAREMADLERLYDEWLTERRHDRRAAVERLAAEWNAEAFRGQLVLTDASKATLEKFLGWMTEAEIRDAMDVAIGAVMALPFEPQWTTTGKKYQKAIRDYDGRFRYLCGICYRTRRRRNGEEV